GWCPKCGYCRSIEEDKAKETLKCTGTPRKTSGLGMTEFFDLLRRVPAWVWGLLVGAALLAGVSVAADRVLPPESLARALWSSIQLGLGLIGLIAAQIWVLIQIAHLDDKLGAKDIVISGRL